MAAHIPTHDFNNQWGSYITSERYDTTASSWYLWRQLLKDRGGLEHLYPQVLEHYSQKFGKLFNGYRPISFHNHVSDITPLTIASLMLHFSNTSTSMGSTYAANRETALKMLGWKEIHVWTPRFAVMSGSYGAAYGPQAHISTNPAMKSVACGPLPISIDIDSSQCESLHDQLSAAKEQGCIAFLIEMVRSSDGHPIEVDAFQAVAIQCERVGLALVVDECLTAFRCGAPFACQRPEYISKACPDFVLFGKGLQISGVGINYEGAINRKYLMHGAAFGKQIASSWQSLVTKAVPLPVLIDSLNIIENAIQHDWASRSQKIGTLLRQIIHESMSDTTKIPQAENKQAVGGLDALIYLPQKISQKFLVMSAGNTGSPVTRWLPLMDHSMTQRDFLHQHIFGPTSIGQRKKLAQRYERDHLRPLWCLYCGVKTVGLVWCRTCCIGSCEDPQCTIAYSGHQCLCDSKI